MSGIVQPIQQIPIGNSVAVTWKGMATDEGTVINDATVAFTLKDSSGVAVSGASAITMGYVAGTSGNYRGILSNTVTAGLTAGARYQIVITASTIYGQGQRYISCDAEYAGVNA